VRLNFTGAEIAALYQNQSGCPVHGSTAFVNVELPQPPATGIDEKTMLEIYVDVQGHVKTHGRASLHINPDLYRYTRDNLTAAIDKVYPGLKYDHPDFDMAMKLRNNASRFAGYKTAWQTAELMDVDDTDAINSINKKYNTNYMRSEYEHTVRSTRAAKNWQNFAADADLYPYLEYMPSTAGTPRSEHMKLYGVIKALDDPFWDTWLPPADWGCKCSVQQRRSDKGTTQPPEEIKQPPQAMRNNPGKDGQIFTDKHPMISKVSKATSVLIENETSFLKFKHETRSVLDIATDFIGNVFKLETKTSTLDVRITKNSVEKNLRWDKWFDTRCQSLINLPELINKCNYIGSKKVIKSDYTNAQWVKKRKIKNYHFFEIDGGYQFDIEERWDGQITLYNIKVIK
jgi:hypothetical protein